MKNGQENQNKQEVNSQKTVIKYFLIGAVIGLISLIAFVILYNVVMMVKDKNNQAMDTECIDTSSAEKDLSDKIRQKIVKDNFDDSSNLGKDIEKFVEYSIGEIREDEFDITVEYTDVSDELLVFMESIDAYSDEDFNEEVNEILADKEIVCETFTLVYMVIDENVTIEYTDAFKDAFSCGLTTFCEQYFDEEELKDNVYENLENLGPYYEEKRYGEVPPLTNAIIYGVLECMQDWMTIQTKSFDKLSDSQKLEIAAVMALKEQKSADGVSFKKSVIDDIMLKYFDMVPDYDNIKNTDLVRIKNDTVELFWENAGFQLNMKIISVENVNRDTFNVEVKYFYDFEGVGYDYSVVEYEIKADPYLETWYYIKSCDLDYVFVGFEQLMPETEENAYLDVFGGMNVITSLSQEWETTVDRIVHAMEDKDYAKAKYECLPREVIEVICRNNNKTYAEMLSEAEHELKKKTGFDMDNYSDDCVLLWEIAAPDFEYVSASDYTEDYTANGQCSVKDYRKIYIKIMILGANSDVKAQFYERICLFQYDGGWGGFIE